jgi:metal-sulfur cluster biosynthetic enzyme
VDLGPIYDVQVHNAKVAVKMTLTPAGCPMQASVGIILDPPWNPAMISEYGRSALGICDV